MIGVELKVLRLLHNIKTQKRCAELLGVTERTIATVETSHDTINDRMMREMRAVFNVQRYEEIKKEFSDKTND